MLVEIFEGVRFELAAPTLLLACALAFASLLAGVLALVKGSSRARVVGLIAGWVLSGATTATLALSALANAESGRVGALFLTAFLASAVCVGLGLFAVLTGLATLLVRPDGPRRRRLWGLGVALVGGASLALTAHARAALGDPSRMLPVFVLDGGASVHTGFRVRVRASLARPGARHFFGAQDLPTVWTEAQTVANGWRCAGCVVERVFTRAGAQSVEVTAMSGKLRAVGSLALQAYEERGNPLWPMRVGSRWVYRVSQREGDSTGGWFVALTTRDVRDLLPRAGATSSLGELVLAVEGAELVGGLRRWTLSVTRGTARTLLHVAALDGETYVLDGGIPRALVRTEAASAGLDGAFACTVEGLPFSVCQLGGDPEVRVAGPAGGYTSGNSVSHTLGALALGFVTLGGVALGGEPSQRYCLASATAGLGEAMPLREATVTASTTPRESGARAVAAWWRCTDDDITRASRGPGDGSRAAARQRGRRRASP